MKYHSKSLLLSIIIHLFLLGIFFFVYTRSVKIFQISQEKRVCVHLDCIAKKVEVKKSKKEERKSPRKTDQRVHKKEQSAHKVLNKKIVKKVQKKIVQKESSIHKEKKIPKKISEKEKHKEVAKPVVKKRETKAVTKKSKPHRVEKQVVLKQKSPEDIYIKNNLDKIATLIHDNLYYPRRARKRGIEGVVVVRFYLENDGSVKSVKIVSSKQAILSRAALKIINELSGKFPKPVEELTLTVPIHYQLD